MLRLLLVLLILIAGLWLLYRALGGGAGRNRQPQSPATRMVQCAHCALYLPEGEALRDGAQFYCCEGHRRAGPAGNSQ